MFDTLRALSQNKICATLIALTLGLLVPLAFAPHGYFYLEIFCLAICLVIGSHFSRRFATALWFIFGLGMFGFGVWWIQVSVHQFGLPLYSFSVSVTAGLIIIQALFIGLFGWLVHPSLVARRPVSILLGIPATWVLVEFLRSWFGSGFPWLLLGYAHVESTLGALAPIGGVHFVSYCVLLVAASATLPFMSRPLNLAHFLPAIAVCAIAVLFADFSWTERVAAHLKRVSLIQGAVPQAIKWHPDLRNATIDLYSDLTEPNWRDDLVVWPETAIPAFPDEVPKEIARLAQRADESSTVLLVGMPTKADQRNMPRLDSPDAKPQIFNSLVRIGEQPGRYDKRHLVPFGEYMPLDSVLRPIIDFLSIPMSDFSRGRSDQVLIDAGSLKIGASICYEDAYSNLLRQSAKQANVLVNISNDAWFGDTVAPHQHLQISQMRALENGRFMLRATNTGISAIIDHRGRVLKRSAQFSPEALSGEFEIREGTTPFTRLGSWPVLLFSIAGFVWMSRRKE